MTILEFTKLLPGYKFHLWFSHLLEDGSIEYDGEYCYHGLTQDFELFMSDYSWIFHIDLSDSVVDKIHVIKHSKICSIDIEFK